MDRTIFDSMRPKLIDREDLKVLLKGGELNIFPILKDVGLVDSFSDFKRQLSQKGLSVERGELNFVQLDINSRLKEEDFIDGIILFRKGKTDFKAVRI